MAAAFDFYLFNLMEAAICTSATSEATGYPKEYLMDMNPDTYWKPTSTADQTIVIDLGSAKAVDTFLFWVHNYTATFTSGTVKVDYSDNGSSWSAYLTATAIANSGAFHWYATKPLWLWVAPTTASQHRYWRIIFESMPVVIELSMIALCRGEFTLSLANNAPVLEESTYHNRSEQMGGGRRFAAGINKQALTRIERSWTVQNVSGGVQQYDMLRSIYDAVRGNLLPLVLVEDDDWDDAKLVTLESGAWQKRMPQYDIYNVTMIFNTVPWIAAGETY